MDDIGFNVNTKPFGYAIVDKDDFTESNQCGFYHDLKAALAWLPIIDEKDPENGPYRIVELYTKEQLENEKDVASSTYYDLAKMIQPFAVTGQLPSSVYSSFEILLVHWLGSISKGDV